MEEVQIPEEVAKDLISFLTSDPKATLLLRGFLIGKGLTGDVVISGDFKIKHKTPT